jgi:signal transduction histidine kinase
MDRAQARIKELEARLEEAERLASVGLTMAGMAHTIKNILGGLEGGIYVVDSGLSKGDQDRVTGGWEMVKTHIEKVSVLVKNLLRYSRAEDPERELVQPADLLQAVAELHESKAELAGIALEVLAAPGLPALFLDKEGMHAALTNLVSNALDACMWDPDAFDKEMQITLSARPHEGGGVVFQVSDTGPGISEENQPKILSAFFTTKGMRGTGLGLLLTRKSVHAHGGEISFQSTPGVGSTFRITLPAATRQSAVEDETSEV